MRRWLIIPIVFIFFLQFSPMANAEGGAFLVMDGRFGKVLEQQNADTPLPMASTTKVMTALVALEQANLKDSVVIPRDAEGIEGSSLYIKAGDRYSVEELLYGLLLRSANDCAEALAWYAGGEDREKFIEKMNEKAKELGLEHTRFANPSGLPSENHYTTARELALIMQAAMKNADFRKICGTKSIDIKGQRVVNHNKLLSIYKPCIGGKTGYTMEAGRCLVTMAQQDGASLICVTLGRRGDWDLHMDAYQRWFERLEQVVLAEAGNCRVELPVAGGGCVVARNSHSIITNLFQNKGEAEKEIHAPQLIYGNQRAGDVVGRIEYRMDGVLIGESPLVLEKDLSTPLKKELFLNRIFRFFRQLFLKKD